MSQPSTQRAAATTIHQHSKMFFAQLFCLVHPRFKMKNSIFTCWRCTSGAPDGRVWSGRVKLTRISSLSACVPRDRSFCSSFFYHWYDNMVAAEANRNGTKATLWNSFTRILYVMISSSQYIQFSGCRYAQRIFSRKSSCSTVHTEKTIHSNILHNVFFLMSVTFKFYSHHT